MQTKLLHCLYNEIEKLLLLSYAECLITSNSQMVVILCYINMHKLLRFMELSLGKNKQQISEENISKSVIEMDIP